MERKDSAVPVPVPDTAEPTDRELEGPQQYIRQRLMIDGWEFVRLGHQILAGTNASPGAAYHASEARTADRHAKEADAALDALVNHRREGKRRS